MISRAVRIFLLISLVLHLAALFLADQLWQGDWEGERFRARLASPPRFETPPRWSTDQRPELPQTAMEYLPAARLPGAANELEGLMPTGSPAEFELPGLVDAELPVEEPEPVIPQYGGVAMPSPSGPIYVDSLESEAMELVRIEDRARADGERAMVILDRHSKRDLTGYVNFTLVRMDGIESDGVALDGLARYLRDYTRILAQVRPRPTVYFRSEQLLKDPIHFLFSGSSMDDGVPPGKSTHMSDKELKMLGRYLREGGFLFIEPSYRDTLSTLKSGWLSEMIVHVHDALEGEGRYFEIPLSHPIYHSFYDFDGGFPGEDKRRMLDVPPPAWYFAKGMKDRRGLWGVELDGELVAVFNDSNLHGAWPQRDEESSEGEGEGESEEETVGGGSTQLMLQVGINIVTYALTRTRGLTPTKLPPAWSNKRPVVEMEEEWTSPDVRDLIDDLGGALALVRAPLGERIDEEGGLRVELDGSFDLQLNRGGSQGVVVRNLVAGRHRIEIEYGGQRRQLEVGLRGDRVLTVTFGLNRLAFVKRLRLKVHREQVGLDEWRRRFSDLAIEERFFEEGNDWLEELSR